MVCGIKLVLNCSQTMIHTGFWGCGAFGGNRILMTILQSLAADLAGVDIVFWASDDSGVNLVKNARRQYKQAREISLSVPRLLDYLVKQRFQWGVSDGN